MLVSSQVDPVVHCLIGTKVLHANMDPLGFTHPSQKFDFYALKCAFGSWAVQLISENVTT